MDLAMGILAEDLDHECVDQGEDDIDQDEDGVLGSLPRQGPCT